MTATQKLRLWILNYQVKRLTEIVEYNKEKRNRVAKQIECIHTDVEREGGDLS